MWRCASAGCFPDRGNLLKLSGDLEKLPLNDWDDDVTSSRPRRRKGRYPLPKPMTRQERDEELDKHVEAHLSFNNYRDYFDDLAQRQKRSTSVGSIYRWDPVTDQVVDWKGLGLEEGLTMDFSKGHSCNLYGYVGFLGDKKS